MTALAPLSKNWRAYRVFTTVAVPRSLAGSNRRLIYRESFEYWRTRARAGERVIADMEDFGVAHPGRVLELKQRIADLEKALNEKAESPL
ncbi:MAG: hypothetical protein H6R14_760 [Proteobacteria bacterium]|nr:hypothetical protein [Pseudomonadota bacterium]